MHTIILAVLGIGTAYLALGLAISLSPLVRRRVAYEFAGELVARSGHLLGLRIAVARILIHGGLATAWPILLPGAYERFGISNGLVPALRAAFASYRPAAPAGKLRRGFTTSRISGAVNASLTEGQIAERARATAATVQQVKVALAKRTAAREAARQGTNDHTSPD